jgi:hypothetical protein
MSVSSTSKLACIGARTHFCPLKYMKIKNPTFLGWNFSLLRYLYKRKIYGFVLKRLYKKWDLLSRLRSFV